MRIDILSIFPDIFEAPLSTSMIGIAREKRAIHVHVHDLRDWTVDTHRTTDDSPYGGGPGMVMKPEPIFAAVRDIDALDPEPAFKVFLTPTGRKMDQALVVKLAEAKRLLLVCGRYEGFDERAYELADLRLSVGDYVVSGGEIPAMLVVDAVARLIPGVLGHEQSAQVESFADGLLEYPQYTRPPVFEGMEVPDVLRSGDHARIAAWRREQAVKRTATYRPDLLEDADLDANDRRAASERLGEEAQSAD